LYCLHHQLLSKYVDETAVEPAVMQRMQTPLGAKL
jgi:hypothetical protein